MKRKMSKKVLCLCMVAVLAIGLAIPTFAAPRTPVSKGMHIVGRGLGQMNNLNLAGEGNVYTNRNVTVYSRTDSYDQVWYFARCASGAGTKLFSGQASADSYRYALNINNSTNNCNVYQDVSNNDKDSLVVKVQYQGDPYTGIGIELAHSSHWNYALGTSGTNVVWQYTGTTSPIWDMGA